MNNKKEQIILGIDPGTSVMGYGVIHTIGNKVNILQYGVIHLKKYEGHELKLSKIFERVSQLIEEYHPDHVALEAPFFGKNVQSMLKLGRAQGVAMAAALSRQIPITEYAPKKVKMSVTGKGTATKEQVAEMLQLQYKLEDIPKLLDATDALAVAICHHYQGGVNLKQSKGWGEFLKNNPDRVK